MAEKKTSKDKETKPIKVVKKSANTKMTEEKKAAPTEADLKLAESLLFGDTAEPEVQPIRKKVGIIRKSTVHTDAPEPASDKSEESSVFTKMSATPQKTRIIKKKDVEKAAAEREEAFPSVAVPATTEKPSPVAKLEELRRVAKEYQEEEAAKKKKGDEKKEPVREKQTEIKFASTAEESIRIIREEEEKVNALSLKEFQEKVAVPAEEEYEEFDEIVEEIVEEVEYEEEIPAVATAPVKRKPDEPSDFNRGGGQGRRRRKKKKKTVADKLAAKDAVRRTLAQINVADTGGRKRYKRTESDAAEEVESNIINVSEFMSVSEIANQIGVKPAEVIAACMKLGFMVTINQRLDFDVIAAVVDEFGFQAQLMEEYTEETLLSEQKDDPKDLVKRSPIVTIMGHVDHGKTSLLDYIRKANVVAGEAGGITQHIGAYRVNTSHGLITFLDTPGHEAFATMRARGANITDLIVLVVAADSNVMPQTIESIDHAKAAGVKVVVALNKMDLPTANAQNVKSQLAHHGIIVEEFGGKNVCVEISCKSGKNIDKLLESIALEAELLELKANPDKPAVGTIIESKLDSRLGVVATVLITGGTLRIGDNFVTGPHYGRVKLMADEFGRKVESAEPATPVLVVGLSGTPRAGDTFVCVENERVARDISVKRSQVEKEREQRQIKHMSLDELYSQIKLGGVKDINLVIKGDVDGSVEALSDSLQKLSTPNIKINIIHKSVGAIKESDILLAATTNAIIIGFHIYPNSKVRELAQQEGVEIRIYKIIYEVVEQMQKAMEGMRPTEEKEVVLGSAEVRNVFKISKIGNIAGCLVTSGVIKRTAKVRLLRDGKYVIETRMASLKRIKDDASEVVHGFECGILLENFNDIKPGDVIETFEIQQVKPAS